MERSASGREVGWGPDSIPPPGASWFGNTKKLQVESSAGGSGGSWLAAQGNRPITPFCLVMQTCQRGTSELEEQQETFLYRPAPLIPAQFSAFLSFFPPSLQPGKHPGWQTQPANTSAAAAMGETWKAERGSNFLTFLFDSRFQISQLPDAAGPPPCLSAARLETACRAAESGVPEPL